MISCPVPQISSNPTLTLTAAIPHSLAAPEQRQAWPLGFTVLCGSAPAPWLLLAGASAPRREGSYNSAPHSKWPGQAWPGCPQPQHRPVPQNAGSAGRWVGAQSSPSMGFVQAATWCQAQSWTLGIHREQSIVCSSMGLTSQCQVGP